MEIPLNTASYDQLQLIHFLLEMVPKSDTQDYAKLPTAKQTRATSKYSIEFITYSDFPCHFKVNRDMSCVD